MTDTRRAASKIMSGLREALAFARGEPTDARVNVRRVDLAQVFGDERFDFSCVSGDRTRLILNRIVGENDIGITCCTNKGTRFYLMADARVARKIAAALCELADQVEAVSYE